MNRLIAIAWVGALLVGITFSPGSATAQTSRFDVIASGLDSPRGLRFGPDGNLYVAEAGSGGSTTTVDLCTQVPVPIGPYGGGDSARISMIRPDGTRTVVMDHLASAHLAPPNSNLVVGAQDVAFIDDELYALLAGGGCSHGNPDSPSSVIKVDRETGTYTQVANLSEWVLTHPAAVIEPDDFEPDETFYSMIAVKQKLYAVGPNHGQVVEISRDGSIRQVLDISATQGHIVPTAITFHDGKFQVGNLGTFTSAAGTSKVLDISKGGKILNSVEGFTAIVGLAYRNDKLYALQLTTPLASLLTGEIAGQGKVVRLEPSGAVKDVVTGLTLPGAMTFDQHGDLYISNFGTGFPPGSGQIVRVRSEAFERPQQEAKR